MAARIASLRQLAGERPLRFGISVRPVVGADGSAVEALSNKIVRSAPTWMFDADPVVSDAARLRILAAATGARGSAEPFAGSVDEVAGRLRDYQAAGVDVFHLFGFDPLADVASFRDIATRVQAVIPVAGNRSVLAHDVA